MHHFSYRDGVLHAESVDLRDIVERVGTPFYCYATATLTRHFDVLREAFTKTSPLICYAIKANSNQAVIKTLADRGMGMDVVSEGELRRAVAAGVPGERIIFAGVGKTRSEMDYALGQDILSFNVESAAELEALNAAALAAGKIAAVALRVNPDVDAQTHAKISTGKAENKFGIPFDDAPALFERVAALPGLKASGIHMHIGSQITTLQPFRDAFARMRSLLLALREEGHALTHLDLGGGLGVPYRGDNDVPPPPRDYADVVHEALGDLGLSLVLEPGRMIAANAGILVTRVIYTKPGADKTFTIVDAAMNDLLRPTLYEAFHDVWPVEESHRARTNIIQDIVGPVCETGDFLAQGRPLPPFERDDLLALMSAGAYGAVMASTYNSRPLIPEVMVNGTAFHVVRPRPSYDALIGLDAIPPWLER
ncbi:MAG: diaminopimelate decarboxylase [Pseudomonadota bacterium]